MSQSSFRRAHGVGLRGANLSRSSLLFEGPFGRIFRALPAAEFGSDEQKSLAALSKLAGRMTAEPEPLDEEPDAEESGIPAAYTYLGQFIDHDLTFDPASSLQKQNDPDALVDYRTPRFDLDNVYGRGPDDQPYMYSDGRTFAVGRDLTGAAANPKAKDLARAANKRAIIGDPRNDENVIVSQLQGLFLRFHNRIASEEPSWTFERVQREVRFYYQWMVLNDFLPTIVSQHVLDQVVPHLHHRSHIKLHPPHLEFFHPKNEGFMPLEFSAAAYRFGHSMVRPGYRVNEIVPPLPIFSFTDPNLSMSGFREFQSNWAIDWNLFIDLEPAPTSGPKRLQRAYRIDTSLVNPLGKLPPSIAINPNVLAERNLIRGYRMRLPSGQAIARAMGITPLRDEEILIGKFTGDAADKPVPLAQDAPEFAGNCPLWTYVLAETKKKDVTVQTTDGNVKTASFLLGPVGGRIVAETFVGLLLADSSSYIAQDPLWTPKDGHFKTTGFGLRDFIRLALGGA